MRKLAFILFALTIFISSKAQNMEQVKRLIGEGIGLHDKGDYAGAIEKYDQVLTLDEHNITAYSEKAMSLSSLSDFEGAIEICEKAIQTNPKSETLGYIYIVYGNALDAIKQAKKAIEVYDQGIELFPDFYQLYFNRGITYSSLEKFDEAILNLQTSSRMNPFHPGSQNAMGRLLFVQKQNIPALLAFCRFAIIEPTGPRAASNLLIIRQIMGANVEKTRQNHVTISISPDMLTTAEDKNKKANDFNTPALILAMSAALNFDKKNKKKTDAELFQKNFEAVCSSMEEIQNDNFGFYWEYYAPYFIQMNKAGHIEALSYLVFATSGTKDVSKWLDKNEKKIEYFYKWSSEYDWEN